MRRTVVVFAFMALTVIAAAPASALSCAQPEPIDWSARLPDADAAVIGIVERLALADGDHPGDELSLRVRVTEVLHGRAPAFLEYSTANFDPWGPYYEIGQEIAIVIEDGTVSDGQMNLCGPWFSPEELRQAADDFGRVEPSVPSFIRSIIAIFEIFAQLLLGQ